MKYLQLIRWPNLLIMAGSMLLIRFFLIVPQLQSTGIDAATSPLVFSFLVAAVLLIAAGGFVINDIFDADVDGVNKPEKQLVGKSINLHIAQKMYWSSTTLGLLLGIYIGYAIESWRVSLIFIVMAGMMWFYSKRYKRMVLIGNFVVAFSTGMVLLIVWLVEFFALQIDYQVFAQAMRVYPQITGLVMAYTLFAVLTNVSRELIKDIEDVKGDKRFGCRTYPVVYGETQAKNLSIGLMVILLFMIGFWQYILHAQGAMGSYKFLFIADALCAVAIIRVTVASDKKHFKQASFILKMVMLSGLISILFL